MAKHLAQQEGRHTTNQRGAKTRARFGRVRLPELPSLSRFRPRLRRASRTYVREFSLPVMAPVLAAVVLFIAACFLPLAGWPKITLFVLAAAAAAFTPLWRLILRVLQRRLPDESLLVIAGVILAFCIGKYAAGAIAMILSRVCELVEAFVLAGGDGALDAFRDILPEKARVESEDDTRSTVPENVAVGEVLRVMAHEVISLDGKIVQGQATVDFSPLTGVQEDLRALGRGEEVYAGCVCREGELLVSVTRPFEECVVVRLLESVENSAKRKAWIDRLTSRICLFYVPAVALLALIVGLVVPLSGGAWSVWLPRAAVLLLLSSASAPALSVPLSYRGAVQGAAFRGTLIRGQDKVETLARTRTMVFGKTGTITEGEYTITELCPDGVEAKDLLAIAAAAESFSVHPIARALKAAAGWTGAVAHGVLQVEEIPGMGVSAFIQGRHVYVGNAALLESHGIWFEVPKRSGAAIHVAVENVYWGHILVSDKPREGAFDALEGLRIEGVNNMVMLTGDVLSVSRPIASSLNFDMVKAELSQQGKLSAVEYLLESKGSSDMLAYVGDGVNDAALLEKADVGLTISSLRNAAAEESADIAILGNDIQTLPAIMHICVRARRIALMNAAGIGALKLILLILALTGVLPIPAAAIVELLMTGLAMFNALRAFGTE